MLSQMTDKLDVRLDGSSIDTEHLDITRYLSAPNRFNTFNAHLGTVCRIFGDFPRMICWYKRTASYNIATDRKCETVNIFGLKEGQVDKS